MILSGISIWYFSGTGNAKYAANRICESAIDMGYKASVHDIANKTNSTLPINNDNLLGFCYPTHGFNAPPIVLHFLLNFPRGKLGKIHTPGVGGLALWLPAIILWIKGYKPIGFRPLDMPSNWISIHPGLKTKVALSIKQYCETTLQRFTHRITEGKKVINGFLWFPLDIVLSPISILYYCIGRFAIAKTFVASYKCNSCGLCIKQCPANAIIMKSGRPYWTFSCESCMKCMNSCPERAIETAHGYTFLLFWAAFWFLPALALKLLIKYGIVSSEFYLQHQTILDNALIIALGLVVIFFGYKILHYFMRFKPVNWFITHTALTHYKFWRRYRLDSKGMVRRVRT